MSKTLLLADDSITIQKVVGITFANEDFEILSVDNGEDAVTKAREVKPDIVLADVVMPKLDGYQVCEQIKQDPALSKIPVLLLTGAFKAFDEVRSQKVGADDYISKPFDSQSLIDKVNQLIAKGASPQAPQASPPTAAMPTAIPVAPSPVPPSSVPPTPTSPAFQTPDPFATPQAQPPIASPIPATPPMAADPFATPSESTPSAAAWTPTSPPPAAATPPEPVVSPQLGLESPPSGSMPPMPSPDEAPSPMELSMFEGLPRTIDDHPQASPTMPPQPTEEIVPHKAPENIWSVPQAVETPPIETPPKKPAVPEIISPQLPPDEALFSQSNFDPKAKAPAPAPAFGETTEPQSFPTSQPPVPEPQASPPPWATAIASQPEPAAPAFTPPTPEPPATSPQPPDFGSPFVETPKTTDPFSVPTQSLTAPPVAPAAPESPFQAPVPTTPSSIPEARPPEMDFVPPAVAAQEVQASPTPEAPVPQIKDATREVIEKIAWEIIPDLAESIIREEINRLKKDKGVFS